MRQTFFLGGNSPSGFRSRFINQIKKSGYYTYILKGGPGTGKSTFMKKAVLSAGEENCELYYCSSDIKSLDAVVIQNKKIIIVDGTAPHTFDPEIPGVSSEIINLGAFWNGNFLKNHSDAIKYCSSENSYCHRQASRYIKAASGLCSEIYHNGFNALKTDKLNAFSSRLFSKILKSKQNSTASPEFRQISAFTSFGYITRDIPDDYTIYLLKDNLFTASDILLKNITENAYEKGIKVIVSENLSFDEQIFEHVIIPEHKIAFISSGFINKIKFENCAIINLDRFYEKEKIANKKTHISFNKRVISDILDSACNSIDTALQIHNELERFYIKSLDTEKLNEFTDNFYKKIF